MPADRREKQVITLPPTLRVQGKERAAALGLTFSAYISLLIAQEVGVRPVHAKPLAALGGSK